MHVESYVFQMWLFVCITRALWQTFFVLTRRKLSKINLKRVQCLQIMSGTLRQSKYSESVLRNDAKTSPQYNFYSELQQATITYNYVMYIVPSDNIRNQPVSKRKPRTDVYFDWITVVSVLCALSLGTLFLMRHLCFWSSCPARSMTDRVE